MKIIASSIRQSGKILITTLVLALLVGIAVSALLFVAQQQNYMTARSRVWASEVPLAEAGIEEAMTHLNSRPTTLAQSGWSLSGTNYVKKRTFTNGYFYTTISSAREPVLVSIGFGRIPLQTNYTSRTILARTKTITDWGIVGKQSVSMNGNPYIDSYDSSDTRYSSNGFYHPALRRDQVGVGVVSALKPAISTGGGLIYGSAATGPSGTVSGNVGDGSWLASNSGLQPGHVSDDFNMAIPDVVLPAPWTNQPAPIPGIVGGVYYDAVLEGGDYTFSTAVNFSTGGVYVKRSVRAYFVSSFKMSGSAKVTLAPGATIDMYIGGSMDLSGHCVVNPTGIPANCRIFGLPTCTSMKYAGTAEAYCKLYAPNADITVTGNFDFFGSVVGNNIQFSGTSNIHYDEALGIGPDFRVVAWEEL